MPLLLGLFALGSLVLLLKWYAEADVRQLKSSLRWTGVLLGLLLILGLAVTGRLGPALGGMVALIAWIWRVFGAWQMLRNMGSTLGGKQSGRAGPGAAGQPGVMDEAEALRILGLSKGATAEEIKAAHRRLMAQLHPDRGGSDYLAAKINAAKDLLLKSAR